MADKNHYLSMPPIQGEAIAPGHEGWIEVLAFSMEAPQQGSAGGGAGTGSGTGKLAFEVLTVSARTGSHSSDLLGAVSTGKHFPSALLDVPEGAGFRRFKLDDVLATTFQTQDQGEGDAVPVDIVSLQANKGITNELIAAPPAKPIDPNSPAGLALSRRQKEAVLHIRVVDENGKERVPKGNDRVFARGERLKYHKDDGFVRKLEGKGELAVTVEYEGFERVQQWFRFDAPAPRPTVAPFWPGTDDDPDAKGRRRDGYLLACMTINRAAGGHDESRSPKVFNLTVTLHPTRMYVAVVGCDYWEHAGTPQEKQASLDFDKYALTYANHLVAAGVLNLSSPMSVLDCQRGRLERWDRVRADGGAIAWKRHQISYKREPCPRWPNGKAFNAWRTALLSKPDDARKYLGANEVYHHLDEIGGRTPGAVVDFSIFSHAWAGGPILFNTFSSPDPARDTPTRFAGDLDMRDWKDFKPGNTSFWNRMPKAFAPNGVVRVWGCFATDLFNKMVRFLLGEGGTKGRFIYKDPAQKLDLDLDRAGVVARLKQTIAADSYMSQNAKFVGRDTYGGLPGFGADNVAYGEIPTLDATLRRKVRGEICHVPRITSETRFRKLFESAELGAQRFNEFGYMLYKP